VSVASDGPGEGRPLSEAVLYERTPAGVAVITLNRPERLNAWGDDLAASFYSCIDRAEDDPAVRVIVLTGRGKAFCAGAQLGSMATIGESLNSADQRDVTKLVGERHPHFVTTLRKPVVAAINGAKFATSFARRGLIAELSSAYPSTRGKRYNNLRYRKG
jgi:enoyl-CoA hydratase/carnithine racemase